MQNTENSSLPTETIAANTYGCITTGHLFSPDNTVTAAITGNPRWPSHSLQQLASDKNNAHALAAAYRQHGPELFEQLQGDFSLIIIDSSNDLFLSATDRMGQHPVYYATLNNGVVFGSSVSAVLAHPDVKREIQPQGIYDYVYFHMVPSPHSIFAGVNKLPAGHLLQYQNGRAEVKNYWQPDFKESCSTSFPDMAKQLKTELKNAVARNIRSGASVGAFLSGGLDSSSVTGMLAEACEREAHAYSIGFSAKGYDEMEYARITAKHFGVKLHEYYVTPKDVVDALPLVASSYDEPFGNSSALPAYFCAKVAAENGVQQLLAGDGGDEIFAGNERYIKQGIFENYGKIPLALRRGLIEPVTRKLPQGFPLASKANSYLDQANTPLPDRLQSYNFLHRHQPNEIFTDDFLRQVDVSAPIALQRHTYQLPEKAETLNRMLYLDWQYTLADNDLRKVSHMCALAGIDVSYPMLDDNLIAFSCSIPSAWKIKGKDLRHFYKQALTGWLPNETIHKKKQGFGLPFGVWMETHKPLQEMAYDSLLRLKRRGYLRPEFIDHAIELHRNHHAAYYGELVWILTVLELWMDKHV
ncbi:MAG: asparagine synthase [Pseudomonadales bacterium]|nr:asparagine synthase [Pseudomonadales bacterium]MCP5302142.1 asparagine synthase [Pseudomonadales bacterium]